MVYFPDITIPLSVLWTFDGTWGKEVLSDLRAWQDKISSEPPEKIAKDAMTANDPGTARAKDVLRSQADKSLENVTGKDVVNKFASFGQRWNPFAADYSPTSDAPAQMVGALRNDYVTNYREQFTKTGDAGAADSESGSSGACPTRTAAG